MIGRLAASFLSIFLIACTVPKENLDNRNTGSEVRDCFFDSTCIGCQRLELPFKRRWARQFDDQNFLMPYIIHISFKEEYFEIVNNALVESEILLQKGKRPYYQTLGIDQIPIVTELKWSDSTFLMIGRYYPYPEGSLEEPHPLDIGYLNKDISTRILKKTKIWEYHFFQLKADTLVQYYFEAEGEPSHPRPLDEWIPQAMKFSHLIYKPENQYITRKYIIEYLGNKCMCKSSLVKVFNKNPIHIKDSPDSFY